jgi:hypothetical protein
MLYCQHIRGGNGATRHAGVRRHPNGIRVLRSIAFWRYKSRLCRHAKLLGTHELRRTERLDFEAWGRRNTREVLDALASEALFFAQPIQKLTLDGSLELLTVELPCSVSKTI